MMNFNSITFLKNEGFKGFISYKDLIKNQNKYIPENQGVYLVLNPDFKKNPIFLEKGVCGKQDGLNANYSIKKLKNKYVDNSRVVYVGKAGGKGKKSTLNSRLGQFLACSKNKSCAHFGGRSIWQLNNYKELIFCWKELRKDSPGDIESFLLKNFKDQFRNKIPFANQNSGKKSNFYVYVINLSKEVLKIKKFNNRNPSYVNGKPCVYVGQSYWEPNIRFKQHKDGYKSNKYAKKYGNFLRYKNTGVKNPYSSRKLAEKAEKQTTERLRKRGYAVWSN